MSGNITPYTNLITSEYSAKPNMMAIITTLVQPFADNIATMSTVNQLFDIDTAVGAQLDVVGQWVGQGRYLTVPLTGVYFSFDTAGVGFDQGTWWNPYLPTTQLSALPDDSYRQLLYAKIADNQWDGTIPNAYTFMEKVFPNGTFFIQDNQDMSISVGVTGVALNAVTTALLTGGYLIFRPSGVRIAYYIAPSVSGGTIFGFDLNNTVIGGFDIGSWETLTQGS